MTGKLLAWGLARRSAWRQRRLTAQLAATVAVPVMALTALTSLNLTADFTADEVATTALGRTDLVVRCPAACTLDQIAAAADDGGKLAPGVQAVLAEQDLAVTLTGPDGNAAVPGLLLAYRDPLAAGIVHVDQARSGAPGLALTPPVMEQLGVRVGDLVRVEPGGQDLEVSDAVRYAQSTDARLAVFDPAALTDAGLYKAVTRADAAGSGRLLVQATDLETAVKHFSRLGFRVTTRAALSDAMESRLAPVAAWLVPLVAVIGVCALLTAQALMVRALDRRLATLARLGVTPGETRRALLSQWAIAAGVGFAVGAAAGLAAGLALKGPMQAAARQLWGPFEADWLALAWTLAALAASILVAGLGLIRSPAKDRVSRTHPSRVGRRSLIAVTARRLASQSRLSSIAGTAALTLTVGTASAALIVIDFSAGGLDGTVSGELPPGFAAFGLNRSLSEDEVALLQAGTGGRAFTKVRAVAPDGTGDYALAFLADGLTDCLKQGHALQFCGDAPDQTAGEVVIADSPSALEALLGRTLTTSEVEELTGGDGLLLADEDRWRGIGFLYASDTGQPEARRPDDITGLTPLLVPGFADYWQFPGLVLSSATAERLGLQPEPSTTGTIGYLMSPFDNASLDAAAIRAALPPDTLDVNGVTVQDLVTHYATGLRNARLAVGIGSVAVVFIAMLLLVSSWAGQAERMLRGLDRLGASRAWAAAVLMRRSAPVAIAAILIGGLGSRWLAQGFLTYAYNGWTPDLPVTPLDLLPAACLIAIVPLTCALFAAPAGRTG